MFLFMHNKIYKPIKSYLCQGVVYTCLGRPGSMFDKENFLPGLLFIIFLIFAHYGAFGVGVLT